MILLPSRGRPHHLSKFIEYYHEAEASEPVTLLLDNDDAVNYAACDIPEDWGIDIAPRVDITFRRNSFFNRFPNYDYYAVLGDDMGPMTKHWDTKLKEACLPDKIAYPDDGIQGKKLATIQFIGGDLCRALGWVVYPKIRHWFNDNTVHQIGLALDNLIYLEDVKIKHNHWVDGSMEKDKTHEEVPDTRIDQYIYEEDFLKRDLKFIVDSIK